ncbi:hypothetical protein [Nostoc sp. PCC 7524]|uniref:hypothetical protein n=1 Tax=Nostoc sp. (strain ATCC 29411 / PCC 7524) TaxID=28072 RepID=UPI000A708B4A|nr:hypothetical protein [Nostoc sp. PCC 7524]
MRQYESFLGVVRFSHTDAPYWLKVGTAEVRFYFAVVIRADEGDKNIYYFS